MRIAVAGATGRVGRHVVDVLRESGHEVVPMSRTTGVDVVTGKGLGQALTGVESIIDTTAGSADKEEATAFFTTAARNLQQAGDRAGVRLAVVVSIIGIDKLSTGHPAAKREHEKGMARRPDPGTHPARGHLPRARVADDGLGPAR